MSIPGRVSRTTAGVLCVLLPFGVIPAHALETEEAPQSGQVAETLAPEPEPVPEPVVTEAPPAPEPAPAARALPAPLFPQGQFTAPALTAKETRLGGANRYATATEISKRITLPTRRSDMVFIASGANFADGLSIGALAAYTGSPLLLTSGNTLPAETLAELAALRPSRIIIGGGVASVSQSVEAQLSAMLPGGKKAERLQGKDRYGTSRTIAAAFPQGSRAFVTTGANFADATVAGAAAAKVSGPVILTTTNATHPEALAALATLAPSSITVIGGAWTSRALADFAAAAGAPTPQVLSGRDRYETGVKVATALWGAAPARIAYASGADFPDALAGVGVARAFDAPVMLTRPTCLPDSAVAAVAKQTHYVLLGGTSSTSTKSATAPCTPPAVSLVNGVYSFSMEWKAQQNGYYCGPAVGQMILQKLGRTRSASGVALSQKALAGRAYFATDYYEYTPGEYNQLTKGLNAWLGGTVYTRAISPTGAAFKQRVIESFTTTKRPVAVLTQEDTGGIHYNNHPNREIGHYLIIEGYDTTTGEIIALDPAAGMRNGYEKSAQRFRYDAVKFADRFLHGDADHGMYF